MTRYGMLISAAWISLALLLTDRSQAQETPPAATQTIIVLDASGSMWGQIDGVAKIDIAKEVIKELLESLDPKLELGLMAYGHRRKGDCSDIELMIPPGEVNRSRFLEVNWTGPAGKNDFVIVTEKSAPDNLTSGYNYTNKGTPVTVFVPDVVGPGEVRYVSGKTKTVLKRQPLDIVEPVATLSEVPATAKPKSWIEFQWTGPENRRDNFTVAKPGAAAKDAVTLRRVAPGEPGKVRAPKKAGDFELRYVSASGKILASQVITIAE